MKLLIYLLGLSLLLVACLEGDGTPYSHEERYSEVTTKVQKGAINFLYHDLGSIHGPGIERGGAFPWNITQAAIRFANGQQSDEQFREKLKSFGFLFPERIKNIPAGIKSFGRFKNTPLGIVRGNVPLRAGPLRLGNVDTAILGCAACHSAPGYDSDGQAIVTDVWLGGANSSFNAEGFVQEVYRSYRYTVQNKEAFYSYFNSLFEDKPENKRRFLKRILETVESQINYLESVGLKRLSVLHNGGPGRTNGVAALKNYVEVYDDPVEFYENDRGFVSIPVVYDRQFRTSLLVDGLYGVLEQDHYREVDENKKGPSTAETAKAVAYFTVPTAGNLPKLIPSVFGYADEVMEFLDKADRERFPGTIDLAKASRGQKVYQKNCQSCHGVYSEDLNRPKLLSFPNRLIEIDKIKTDPVRLTVVDQPVMQALKDEGVSNYVSLVKARGYVAPLLSQLWKTAPYLHNGSVPTIASLIGLEPRPEKFQSGGHHLDYEKLGIKGQQVGDTYQYQYKPWSQPEIFDTKEKGQGNQGHEKIFHPMEDEEKWALIEYLKLL